MRHGKKINHLGRKSAHRKAMLANMACSLIEHKRINTTVAKAKALKQFIEPLVTKSKEDTTHNRRIVFNRLRDKYAVTELFRDVAVKVADRPGGYTRIIKLGNRLGDNADMALIELVDYNETYDAGKPAKKKSTRRGRSKKSSAQKSETATAEAAEETAVDTENTAAPAEEKKAKAPKKEPEAKKTDKPEEGEAKKPSSEE
ncbi:50S ribosomal protein L17 [Sinomicrobium kalidii]|uniref:50S ribosomal protein L17 n=1 Tax=Sinomicrobium kalidii TaxID=2900738 RepID=UPI001E5948C9|nr:50S ribosomal protein L17 [Sinomicrobium kalidii]UGU14579.1 50S ribosomal protein L17 [Sinomicrobium kalidii]